MPLVTVTLVFYAWTGHKEMERMVIRLSAEGRLPLRSLLRTKRLTKIAVWEKGAPEVQYQLLEDDSGMSIDTFVFDERVERVLHLRAKSSPGYYSLTSLMV